MADVHSNKLKDQLLQIYNKLEEPNVNVQEIVKMLNEANAGLHELITGEKAAPAAAAASTGALERSPEPPTRRAAEHLPESALAAKDEAESAANLVAAHVDEDLSKNAHEDAAAEDSDSAEQTKQIIDTINNMVQKFIKPENKTRESFKEDYDRSFTVLSESLDKIKNLKKKDQNQIQDTIAEAVKTLESIEKPDPNSEEFLGTIKKYLSTFLSKDGGKSKKRSSKSKSKSKKHGGSYNLPAMYNVDGLISAGNDPVTAASVHVGTMMNTPSPFSSGMNTDFNDSTRTIPRDIIQNVVPKVGVTQTGGRRSKPKSKASKRT